MTTNWDEEEVALLTNTEMLAIAHIINEVQRHPPDTFAVSQQLIDAAGSAKVKLWSMVKPLIESEKK